ncbi:voltage-gated protein/chloride channel-like protein [Microthyrium microscopicum]|uniref:Voltage-gated protein/chloride channel-like protein n=1 Tax=Microthyrium microscopicum TaxID=703497 RepID=A0A6A6USK2_9PEZI|nr:voltage-gated protein/chloride channel-like protein [Microthyrium microscopicum]
MEEDDRVLEIGQHYNDERERPTSPLLQRRTYSTRSLDPSQRFSRRSNDPDESSSLLDHIDGPLGRSYRSIASTGPATPRPQRQHSYSTNARLTRNHSRRNSAQFSQRLVNALGAERTQRQTGLESSLYASKSFFLTDRVWYDQFTSTDWVHDQIADAFRVKALHNEKGLRGRLHILYDAVQGWILVAIIGILTALVAYFVNVAEGTMFDYKSGYCETGWYLAKKKCCSGASICDNWRKWSQVIRTDSIEDESIDFLAFIAFVVSLSVIGCMLTLMTKTVIPSSISITTLDENLGADRVHNAEDDEGVGKAPDGSSTFAEVNVRPSMVYYAAAGSGVAEIKVIVSGFVLHGYLGVQTLVIKALGLVFSVASGLSVGKEGPFVHIATCVGNVCCRLFPKYNRNDMKRREALSAAAASGVAVAFGAPIAGVLFSLEEISYYFPPKTLFRTFFCCIVAALSLKFLNPYGTNKIVLFEVRYITDWYSFEMPIFIFLGILGGVLGALFIKATRIWAQTFRRIPAIKKYPMFEVILVALVTGIVSFWNRYTRIPVTELLLELASPCDAYSQSGFGLCPDRENIPNVIWYLSIAFVIKAILTTITFGIKIPAGIYVPSMVVGGILGRIVGHGVQYLALTYPSSGLFGTCNPDGAPEDCVVPGVYAMVAAGATMCGVTRLSVTLAVILFELTGSLDHVLPFSIGVLVSKWTADMIEPRSIYDLLTDMNSYPFLDNKHRPIFTSEFEEIIPRHLREPRYIDITASPLVPATELRGKLEKLHEAGEIDGGLPILRNGVLVGLIPAPDLEFALDKLDNEENSLCLMASDIPWQGYEDEDDINDGGSDADPTDFTRYIDPAPVALDVHSPLDLVFECFVKLGLRYVCASRDGLYAGMVHKKAFVKYCKDLETAKHNTT